MQGEEADRQDSEINTELEEILADSGNALSGEENPLPHVAELKKSGILRLVLPQDYQISDRQIAPEEQPSGRNLIYGRGSFYTRQGMEGAEERLLFHEYLIKKFGNAVNEVSAKRSLGYELEYILSGCASDRENLEAVVKKLLGIRFGINYLYLQTRCV